MGELTVKAFLVCYVVDQQNSHGTSVVGCGNGAETLLARGIPYLQLDALAVEFDCADLEVDSDGGDEGGSEGIFAEA